MKKVLLIGKLSNAISEINESLSRRFQVQLCGDSIEILQGMLKIVKPDLVVLNLSDMPEIAGELLQLLEEKDSSVPVITIVTDEQSQQYKEYLQKKQFEKFSAPIRRAELVSRCFTRLNISEAEMRGETQLQSGGKSSSNRKKRILIVDDSPLALRTTRAVLGNRYDVVVATSAKQALQIMKTERPDLILLDYEMPDCDGKMTLQKIREDKNLCDIPVIFVTGVADKDHIAAVLGLNPAGYFLKPLEKEKVLSAIESIIG